MSSNNLGRNLAWLLSTKPFLPPPATSTSAESSTAPQTGQNCPQASHSQRLNPSPNGASSIEDPHDENASEALVDTPPIAEPTNNMAKLCSGPTSSQKPRLQVRALRPSKDTPTYPSSARPQLSDVPVTRNIHDEDPRVKIHISSPLKSPSKARPKVAVDTVDLTGDEDRGPTRTAKKTVTAQTPRMARSQGIEQPEVLFRTSRKRKSEEFESDVRANPRAYAGFTSIEDISNDPPPPYSTSVALASDDLSTYFSESSVDLQQKSYKRNPKVSSNRESRHEEVKGCSGGSPRVVEKTEHQVGEPVEEPQVVRSTPHAQPEGMSNGTSKERGLRRTVADSDDEMELSGESERQRTRDDRKLSLVMSSSPKKKLYQPRDAGFFTSVPIDNKELVQHNEADCQTRSMSTSSTPCPPASRSVKAEHRLLSGLKANLAPAAHVPGNLQLETFKDSDSLFRAFAEWSHGDLQHNLDNAILLHKQTSRLFADALFETGDPDSSEVIEANTSDAAAKIREERIKQLLDAREKHHEISNRKRDLHKLVVTEQQRGGDINYDHVRAVSRSLRENEARIVVLIKQAGLDVYSRPALITEHQHTSSNIAVQSTQAIPPRPSFEEASKSTTSLLTLPQTQLIRQTQGPAVGHNPYDGAVIRATERRRQTQHIDTRTRNTPVVVPTVPQNSYAIARTESSKHLPDSSFHEDDFEDDEEALFDTHMGSPPARKGRGEGVYDVEDDDEEMLEAIDELETAPSQFPARSLPFTKNVLLESSGNSLRVPSATKLTKSPLLPSKTATAPSVILMLQYPWSMEVKAALLKKFHLRGFRQNQLEAINATLNNQDVFVLMPTGGGKSLCYQLPAIIRSGRTRGLTIVVSPLLSLMEDQILHLRKLNIQAQYINGEVSAEEKKLVMGALKDPKIEDLIQLLYITPEMLSKNLYLVDLLRNLNSRKQLARFVIDEAHCVSQWGHDFRPDYKALGDLRQQFQDVPFMALTATATQNVKADVIHNLHLEKCQVFVQSFNRPNLTYEVRSKPKAKELLDSIAEIINSKYKNQSGIVYCLARKKCEEVAQQLSEVYGIKAYHYHAAMDPAEKSHVQKEWQAGRYQVIVATIAFGMGIDKPDVRFVIHHSIPKSLEGYYQETGRAGRDGKRSGCYLFYGYQDFAVLKRMIEEGEGGREQIQRGLEMLRNVVHFCENKSDCRRVQVLNYFSEKFKKEDCKGACDNCNSTSTFELKDFTEYAKQAVRLVGQIHEQKVTLLHCVDVFRGSRSKKIVDAHHDALEEYGAGKELERSEIERLFYRLIGEDALLEESKTNKGGFTNQYIHTGRNRYQFERGNRRLELQVRMSPTAKRSRPIESAAKLSKKKTASKAGTGVKASRSEYPMSTNISSPVKGHKRLLAQYQYTGSDEDGEDHFDEIPQDRSSRNIKRLSKGYQKDDFVASDHIDPDDFEDDDEIFAPVRVAGRPQRKRQKSLPPPITIDEKMQSLNEIHRIIVDDFVLNARRESKKLLLARNLRAAPFTDTMLTEMAIRFPKDKQELLQIPHIDPDKVELYHKQFLSLVREWEQRYHTLRDQEEDRPDDPNHQNVVDLLTSDDEDAGGTAHGLESSQEEQSSYFHQPDDQVVGFNNQMEMLQSARLAQRPRPKPPANTGDTDVRPYRGGSQAGGKKPFSKKSYRKSNTSNGEGDGASHSRRKSAGPAGLRKASSAKSSRPAAGQRTFVTGGINMMPT